MVCDTGASAGAGWMEVEAVRPRPALSSTRLNVAQTASALTNGLCSSVRSTTRSGSMTKPTFSFHFRSLRITVPYLYVTSIRSTQSWHAPRPAPEPLRDSCPVQLPTQNSHFATPTATTMCRVLVYELTETVPALFDPLTDSLRHRRIEIDWWNKGY